MKNEKILKDILNYGDKKVSIVKRTEAKNLAFLDFFSSVTEDMKMMDFFAYTKNETIKIYSKKYLINSEVFKNGFFIKDLVFTESDIIFQEKSLWKYYKNFKKVVPELIIIDESTSSAGGDAAADDAGDEEAEISPSEWSTKQVLKWLKQKNLGYLVEQFASQNVNGDALLNDIDAEVLHEWKYNIFQIKRTLRLIECLNSSG